MENTFILNEYHILKQILSYLNYRELKSVSEVNQYWKSIAEKIIQKYAECYATVNVCGWPPFDDKIYPKVIIYSDDTDKIVETLKLSDPLFSDINRQLLAHYYNLDKSNFIYLANWKLINTIKVNNKLSIHHSCISQNPIKSVHFRESVLLIPESDNFKVNFAVIERSKTKSDIPPEAVKNSKGCIILTSARSRCGVKIVKSLVETFRQSGQDVAIAGGISHLIMHKTKKDYSAVNGVMITFGGEELSAKSFVLNKLADLDNSFTKIAEILGPLKPSYSRIAFIFSCVERYKTYEENETKLFAKYFPNVPLNGFWSLGEFCTGFTPLTNKRKMSSSAHTTSRGSQAVYQQVSSYLFLTFKK